MDLSDLLTKMNIGSATYITGVKIDDHSFMASVVTQNLFQLASDPRRTERPRDRAVDTTLQEQLELRSVVQRLFAGAKGRNVQPFAAYIADLHEGQLGTTPPITLWTKDKLLAIELDEGLMSGLGLLEVPFDTTLIAIDGETQLAARYEAAAADPRVKKDRVAVVVHHDRPIEWARQAFHDLNVLGVKPNAATSISKDARDVATRIAMRVAEEVPFFRGRVNMAKRQLGPRDSDVVTITALRGAVATQYESIGGVRHGTRPVYVKDEDVRSLQEAAVSWWSAVGGALDSVIEDRVNNVAGAPAVMAAIGAVGHAVFTAVDFERSNVAADRLNALMEINWSRDARWAGIAGKMSPGGILSLGGSKETAYAIFRALVGSGSEEYERVRSRSRAA